MNIVNLTPHTIVLHKDGINTSYGPTFPFARVATTQTPEEPLAGFPVNRTEYGEVENLPEQTGFTAYLVSALVLARVGKRAGFDVFAPDTGTGAIRNEKGQVVAVKGFVC